MGLGSYPTSYMAVNIGGRKCIDEYRISCTINGSYTLISLVAVGGSMRFLMLVHIRRDASSNTGWMSLIISSLQRTLPIYASSLLPARITA